MPVGKLAENFQHVRVRAVAEELLAPLFEKSALTGAINDAWLIVAVQTVAALLYVPFAGQMPR